MKDRAGVVKAALPAATLLNGGSWENAIPAHVWKQARAHSKYDTHLVPDLLRLIRNQSDLCGHGSDGKSWVLTQFPWLLIATWHAVLQLKWTRKRNFACYFDQDGEEPVSSAGVLQLLSSVDPVGKPQTLSDAKERLISLQQLKDVGLMTDGEYDTKRAEIIAAI